MSTIPFRNRPLLNHPLMGTAHTYRPDLPAYDPDLPENRTGGRLVVGNGMPVMVKQVFRDWNGVPGLDMLYVYCSATGLHTHVTPFDVGLTRLTFTDRPEAAPGLRLVYGGGEPYGDALLVERHEGVYYVGDLDPAKRIMLDEYGEDSITESVNDDTGKVVVVEHRGGDDSDYNQFGAGFTSDEAWRYLIGADFGPIDEHYDEDYLRGLLAEAAAR